MSLSSLACNEGPLPYWGIQGERESQSPHARTSSSSLIGLPPVAQNQQDRLGGVSRAVAGHVGHFVVH